MSGMRISWFDRFLIGIAPEWGVRRVRARAAAQLMERHFEAASAGRRTDNWWRSGTDANQAAPGATLAKLRGQARDLVRNNPWARRGIRRIVTSTVGWGITPKAVGGGAGRAMEIWKRWGETTECDVSGKLNFYGLQALAMRTIVESGEVIVRRRIRPSSDGAALPLQIQVLEPDYIDTSKDGITSPSGGQTVQGIEFDPMGRPVAYWLFDRHPGGGGRSSPTSKRIDAEGILHVFSMDRAGQARGVTWFAPVEVRLREFDEYEDATLVKQKIASCLAAFVTNPDGDNSPLGKDMGDGIDEIGPGMVLNLPPGKSVAFSQPPQASDFAPFSAVALRGVAAGLGVTYEDLTGDYSQSTYSSARMARNAFMADVHDWRWNMMIPQFCAVAWSWMVDAAILVGEQIERAPAEWTPPPLPMLDPGTEADATSKMVRIGQMTPDEMIREQGRDPDVHWKEYAASIDRLDRLGIVLDSDPRKTTAAGQAQAATPAPEADAKGALSGPGPDKGDADPDPGMELNPAPPPHSEEDPRGPSSSGSPASKAAAEVKVFAYHQPFMRASEIRESIGLPGAVEDGDLFGGEFLAKHGGTVPGATKSAPNPDDGNDGTSGA